MIQGGILYHEIPRHACPYGQASLLRNEGNHTLELDK